MDTVSFAQGFLGMDNTDRREGGEEGLLTCTKYKCLEGGGGSGTVSWESEDREE